jgi:DNA-binding GntR family transcriptional regulator
VTTSSERVYIEIQRQIINGDLQMGARLGEVELAESLETSRTPIREALRRLAADGLVEIQSNRGARVASWTSKDVNEIFVLRALLEGHGASMAASRITDGELAHLEELHAEMDRLIPEREGPAVGTLNTIHRQFHEAILDAAHSPRLTNLVSAVVQMPLTQRTFRRYTEEGIRRSRIHHRELLSALRAHDPDWAAAVMHAHLHSARMEVLSWPATTEADANAESNDRWIADWTTER